MALKELSDGGPDGTRLGQDSSDKVGFHGAAPSDQYAAIADISVTGTYATDDTPIETAINGILAALREKGIIASS
jgi:hypothetical protein